MKFDQNLDGLVYDGQEIRKKSQEEQLISSPEKDYYNFFDWQEYWEGEGRRLATLREVYLGIKQKAIAPFNGENIILGDELVYSPNWDRVTVKTRQNASYNLPKLELTDVPNQNKGAALISTLFSSPEKIQELFYVPGESPAAALKEYIDFFSKFSSIEPFVLAEGPDHDPHITSRCIGIMDWNKYPAISLIFSKEYATGRSYGVRL